MGKMFKVLAIIFTSIVLLIIVAVIAVPFFIDPNDFKPEIQALVKDNTGRELIIDGDLELSVFPWIGVSTGKLSLSNAQGFSNKAFANINESNVKVKLLPLLSKKIEVSRIVLKGLNLYLAKNKQGVSNWADLNSSEKTINQPEHDNQEESALSLAAFAIGGISIENSQIVWDDQQQGKYTEIKDFNLNTDKLVFDKPVGIDLSLSIVNKEPELTESIIFSTDLVLNEQLSIFNLKKFDLKSVTQGKDIPGEKITATLLAEIAVNLTEQTLGISGLRLNADNLLLTADINGTNIKDKPVFKGPIKIDEFNPAQLMENMAIPLPQMQDPGAMSKFSLSFMLTATTNSADVQNLLIKLDDSNIKGSGSINNFAQPAINFNLMVDAIDVNRYLAPENEEDSSKKVSTPASTAAAGASLFPVETLRALNANGQVTIEKLNVNKLSMKELIIKLNAKNGVIKTQQTVKQLYQGAYRGNTSINVQNKTPMIALDETLANVQIEPLLKDMLGEARMTGLVNGSVRVQGRGNTTTTIKSSLNGNLDFNFTDGLVRGFNLEKIIDKGKALIKGSPLPSSNKNDQTIFSVIKGTAIINKGVLSNNDLYAEASKLRVKGKGIANLATEILDYKIHAKVLKQIGTETEAEKIEGVPLVVNIGGTFSEPSYTLDVAAMLMEQHSEKVEKKKKEIMKKLDDKVLKKLDEKIGPGVGDLIKGFF